MRLRWSHCTFAALALLIAATLPAQSQSGPRTFRIFLKGTDIGSEQVTVVAAPDGWTLSGSGRLVPPLDRSIQSWEAHYDSAWRPTRFAADLSVNKETRTVRTTFANGTASSEISQAGQASTRTASVAADAIILDTNIFGSFEALASRLASAKSGTPLQVFVAPESVIDVSVEGVSEQSIQVPGRTIAARRWALKFRNSGTTVDMEVWTEGDRLLRVDIQPQMLSVVREDIATVLARTVTMARPNDEQITIPADGFSLAATVSTPVEKPAAPRPAVVLVSGTSPTDRDETVAGVPVFAQLADGLADAGFLVVRYDKRGSGQSGGRVEAATLDDFAADARMVFAQVSRRKDVDPRKVSIVGYSDGGWVAMLLASREDRVAAVALLGTASISGRELVLEQQRQRLQGDPSASQEAVDQQKQILEAVISGTGWEVIPPLVRKRVDTPVYKSFLMFEPARVLSKTRQPVIVVQGELDQDVASYHGEQLAQLARGRARHRGAELARLPGLNHLFARAASGEVGAAAGERSISPDLSQTIAGWLRKALAPSAREQ